MPTYVPSNSADISAKGLLDDYAQALSEAIASRTKITELWKVLETTDIDIKGFRKGYSEYDGFEADPSPYGKAAIFPHQLFDGIYRKSLTSGQCVVADSQFTMEKFGDYWAYPKIQLGYIATRHQIQMFCLPEDQRLQWGANDKAVASALNSLGFSLSEGQFPEYNFNDRGVAAGWKQVTASIISEVFIGLTRDDTGGVKTVLVTYPLKSDSAINADIYLLDTKGRVFDLAKKEKQLIESGFKLSQMTSESLQNSSHNDEYTEGDDDDYDDSFGFELIYNDFFEREKHHKPLPVAVLPEWWTEYGGDNWLNEEDFSKFKENMDSVGWTEGKFQAKILLGTDDIRFYPINPEAEPIAGVLRYGSVGASLLHNLNAENKANSITNQLIEKAALTAEAGLKFYEAMLEEHRSAIRKI